MGYKGNLEEVIKQFCDEKWRMSPGETTASRFAKELEWFRGMVKEYAEFFGKTEDEMVAEMEEKRNYSWPNYYQPANFPSLKSVKDDPHFVGLFNTPEDFNEHAKANFIGFRCPKCGNIGKDAQACEHRRAGDGVCDWCANGLFTSAWFVIIPSIGYNKIHIFEPVKKDGSDVKG